MLRQVYRYQFEDDLPMEDVQAAIVIATLSVEMLHGAARARLEAGHFLDKESRALVVDASSEVGQDFNKLLVGYLSREHGHDAFSVRRVPSEPATCGS